MKEVILALFGLCAVSAVLSGRHSRPAVTKPVRRSPPVSGGLAQDRQTVVAFLAAAGTGLVVSS
ncbi:MAG: hypothetical protein ACYDHY_15610 [Acidiferrobacterales bacterium]